MSTETGTTKWWWIRHAPVTGHDGRLYGRSDVSADVSNGAALSALAARLPANAVWIVSPLLRTRQTSAALAQQLQDSGREAPGAVIEPDFIEQDFGAWQGLRYEEIDAALGHERSRFWFAPAVVTPPQGESFAALVDRVAAAIVRLNETYAERDIVAVGHAGIVRAALATALGLDPETALQFSVDTLSLTRIDHIREDGAADAWRVVSVNDRAHVTPVDWGRRKKPAE
ncbi:MAG: histidine phosphatase family protein [Alphaproteobacteria bacterium]